METFYTALTVLGTIAATGCIWLLSKLSPLLREEWRKWKEAKLEFKRQESLQREEEQAQRDTAERSQKREDERLHRQGFQELFKHSNQFISRLEKQLEIVQNRLNELEEQYATLQTRCNALQVETQSQQEAMTSLQVEHQRCQADNLNQAQQIAELRVLVAELQRAKP